MHYRACSEAAFACLYVLAASGAPAMLAGGFAERASRYEIEIIRATDPDETPVDVGLNDSVFPGDIVTIRQGGL